MRAKIYEVSVLFDCVNLTENFSLRLDVSELKDFLIVFLFVAI